MNTHSAAVHFPIICQYLSQIFILNTFFFVILVFLQLGDICRDVCRALLKANIIMRDTEFIHFTMKQITLYLAFYNPDICDLNFIHRKE